MQERIQALLDKANGACVVLHKPENVQYYAGFSGEGMLVISRDVRFIVTDFRYDEQAQRQSPGWEVLLVGQGKNHAALIAQAASRAGNIALCEYDRLTLDQAEELRRALGGVEMRPLEGIPEAQRMVKDQSEVEAIQRAASITDQTFAWVLGKIKPGVTERELELMMYVHMKELGAQGVAFSTIVASGPNASLPHAEPSDRAFAAGDLLTLDFGAKWGGYCSDFTRTVGIGKVEAELRKVYDIVLEAQLRALDGLCAGRKGMEVDAIARGVIEAAGYGAYFGHGLGHAVGRMIHEEPRLSPKGEKELLAGMVVTVEPGIYLPGRGGVRIEDLCLMTEGGHINLTSSGKEYIEL